MEEEVSEADKDIEAAVPTGEIGDPFATTISVEAYTSPEYALAERDRLWRKVWLQIGRLEDIPNVGDFITYEILDDSVIVARTGPDTIVAHHNVCPHRGRRLIDRKPDERNACGRRNQFICNFHGWRFDLDGTCNHVFDKDDWKGALTPENTHLAPVHVDTWGGWIFINLDPDCAPLQEYLAPVPEMLDPFELHNMRFRWRRWGIFDCNWKVAIEAFNETYHVRATHPEFVRFGDYRSGVQSHGLHSNMIYAAPEGMDEHKGKLRLGEGGDPRISTAEMVTFTMENVNTNFTQTLMTAAQRLVDELPEGTPADEVLKHWLESARKDDEKRGVFWPKVDPEHVGKSGTSWQIFPNFLLGHAVNNVLFYNFRPYGYDPNKCIFEAATLELYPEGGEPKTEWEYLAVDDPRWGSVLPQDFSNMAAVQQGMKSFGFSGTKPNPFAENAVVNLHRNLARYMGTGAPKRL